MHSIDYVAMDLYFLLLVLATESGTLNIEPFPPIEELGRNANQFLPVTTLNCRITDAQGTLTARWRHDNDTFTEASSGKYEVTITPGPNVTTLIINPLVYTDSGVYICEVMDDSTSWVNATTELILRTHLNASESSVTVYSNVTSIRLSCDMAGFVPPISDLQWFRNGMMLQNTSDYTILNEGGSRSALLPGSTQIGSSVLTVLMISEPQVEDSGEYQCRIVSLDMSESVQLTVLTTLQPSSSFTTATSTSNTMPSAPSSDVHIPLYIVASCLGITIIVLVSIVIGIIAKTKCCMCQNTSRTSTSTTTLPFNERDSNQDNSHADERESNFSTAVLVCTTPNKAYGIFTPTVMPKSSELSKGVPTTSSNENVAAAKACATAGTTALPTQNDLSDDYDYI